MLVFGEITVFANHSFPESGSRFFHFLQILRSSIPKVSKLRSVNLKTWIGKCRETEKPATYPGFREIRLLGNFCFPAILIFRNLLKILIFNLMYKCVPILYSFRFIYNISLCKFLTCVLLRLCCFEDIFYIPYCV